MKLKPEWDEGLWYLGTLLYERRELFRGMSQLCGNFLSRNSEDGYGWALLGMSEFQTREYKRALDHLQQGMVLGLGDNRKMTSTVSYVIAVLLTRSEKFDESMSHSFHTSGIGRRTQRRWLSRLAWLPCAFHSSNRDSSQSP